MAPGRGTKAQRVASKGIKDTDAKQTVQRGRVLLITLLTTTAVPEPAQAVEHVVQFDATRRTLPGLEPHRISDRNIAFPQGTGVEVLHGCRQLVP